MTYVEALKVVFPLLNGRDLASCMCVCRQWRDIGGDNYFWKALCAKSWPSICKRPAPLTSSYHKLFQMFSKCYNGQNFLSPRLSFDDLEFYIDVWVKARQRKRKGRRRGMCAEERLIFSEVIPGSVLQGGIKQVAYDNPIEYEGEYKGEYKVIIPVEPRFGIPSTKNHMVSISVVVGRRDINKVACIVKKTVMDHYLKRCQNAKASNYLDFSSRVYPFEFPVRSRVSLLYMDKADLGDIDVSEIELDFDIIPCSQDDDFGSSEEVVLWLLGMLNWH